jgi:hypothetical protein
MKLLFFIFLMMGASSQAYEVDNVTCGFRKMKDARIQINAETNKRIRQAINVYNFRAKAQGSKSPPPCGQGVLQFIRGSLANAWFGNLESWVDDAPIDKCLPSKRESIYKDVWVYESPVIWLAGLNSVINVNGTYVGADKFSHFMNEGYQYYELAKSSNMQIPVTDPKNLRILTAIGRNEEEDDYGWSATGVKSYADLVADYSGMEFWSTIIDGPKPMLTCINGEWVQAYPFRWEDHVNQGMDESINCNAYYSENMQNEVNGATAGILEKYDYHKSTKCPIDPAKCREVIAAIKPAELVDELVSPRCMGESDEFQDRSRQNGVCVDPNMRAKSVDIVFPIKKSGAQK